MLNPSEQDEFLQQLVNLLVLPEIKERQKRGELETPLTMWAFQIIFFPDGNRETRINSEVKASIGAKLKQGILKTPGSDLKPSEVEEWANIELTDDSDSECAHVTCIQIDSETWILKNHVLQNVEEAKNHLNIARQFYEASLFCLEKNYTNAFAYNLFNASEITAKSILLSTPGVHRQTINNHNPIKGRFNKLCKDIGLEEFSSAYNSLSDMRKSSRYLTTSLTIANNEAHEILNVIGNLIECAILQLESI